MSNETLSQVSSLITHCYGTADERGVGMKDHLFYLVDANVAIPLRNSFKIQKKLVEGTNFVPETLPKATNEPVLMNSNAIISKGETWMHEFDFLLESDSTSRMKSPFSPSDSFLRLMADEDDDKKEETWDEDEEEWDDEEDDDDDDEEEWDEDDEEWDEDEDWDDEDLDDEDEEWDEDEEEE
jgi:hypothetical protein